MSWVEVQGDVSTSGSCPATGEVHTEHIARVSKAQFQVESTSRAKSVGESLDDGDGLVGQVELLGVSSSLHLALLLSSFGCSRRVPNHHFASHGHTEQARRSRTSSSSVHRIHPVQQLPVPGSHLCVSGEAHKKRLERAVRGVKSQLSLLPFAADGDGGKLGEGEMLFARRPLTKERKGPEIYSPLSSAAHLQLEDHLLPTPRVPPRFTRTAAFLVQLELSMAAW